jgi:hypothetical protein
LRRLSNSHDDASPAAPAKPANVVAVKSTAKSTSSARPRKTPAKKTPARKSPGTQSRSRR